MIDSQKYRIIIGRFIGRKIMSKKEDIEEKVGMEG